MVVVRTTKEAPLQTRIDLPEVFDIYFSPNGTYLCLWCKPILQDKESGVWNKNVKIFNINSNSIISEWSNKHQAGWKPQFTQDEKLFAKMSITRSSIFLMSRILVMKKLILINPPISISLVIRRLLSKAFK